MGNVSDSQNISCIRLVSSPSTLLQFTLWLMAFIMIYMYTLYSLFRRTHIAMMAWTLLMRLRDHPLKHLMLKESAKHGVARVRGHCSVYR